MVQPSFAGYTWKVHCPSKDLLMKLKRSASFLGCLLLVAALSIVVGHFVSGLFGAMFFGGTTASLLTSEFFARRRQAKLDLLMAQHDEVKRQVERALAQAKASQAEYERLREAHTQQA